MLADAVTWPDVAMYAISVLGLGFLLRVIFR